MPKLHLELWPRGSIFEGQRLYPELHTIPERPVILDLEIADAELLLRFWKRCTKPYEQAASAALDNALHDWRRAQTDEEKETTL